MASEETPFQAALARSVREHLKTAGSWPSRYSEDSGHCAGWLADKLNPRRPAVLTIPNIEEIADYVKVDPRKIVAAAFPLEFGVPNPKALVHALAEEHEARTGKSIEEDDAGNQRLSGNARKTLRKILSQRLNVRKLEKHIDVEMLEKVQDEVWRDRTNAFEKAVFQAEELSEKPRKLFTLVCILALLSDLVRTLRTSDYGLRLRLLIHCYKLLDKHPHPGAAAVVAEKAAYLFWNVESDADLCCRILEDPSLNLHPIPARIFAARASHQHNAGNHAIALAELEIAEQLTESPLLQTCIRGMKGSTLIALGDHDRAFEILESVVDSDNEIPADLESNNLAFLGVAYGRRSNTSQAIETLIKALTPSYCLRWPDKAAYVALDLQELHPDAAILAEIQPALVQIQKALLPNDPVESKLKEKIKEMVAAATAYSTDGLMRRNVDPNG